MAATVEMSNDVQLGDARQSQGLNERLILLLGNSAVLPFRGDLLSPFSR